ncbi:MAG: four helix bundle protein [Sulfurovaceae bacterium]|nr:four helix bundle protein [Sulfurovaceae bacterium]
MYYEMLPIFKSTMDLVVYIETAVRGFDKYHKYTIGEDLRTYSKDMLFLIQRANMSRDKQKELVELRNKCEEVKMLIMLAKELKAFKGFKQFEHSSKLTVSVCRQAQAWLKNSQIARVSK